MQEERAITEKKQLTGSKTNRKFNLSSYFLLPIILRQGYLYKGFINSYVYNSNLDLDDNTQYLTITVLNENINLTKHPRYEDHYKKDDIWVYVFNINDYKKDVELFLQGKYSKFSEDLKELLCYNQPIVPIMMSNIYKILYRTQEKKLEIEELIGQELPEDAELCSICDVEDEIL